MDPKATLDAAESAIKCAEQPGDSQPFIEDAEDHLAAYAEWRRKGGFEPDGGDLKLQSLRNRLLALPADSTDL